MTPVTVLTSGVCQQCGATTEECREGVAEERTCCEWCDHYPTPVVGGLWDAELTERRSEP